jgi:uncharacterized protein YoxC
MITEIILGFLFIAFGVVLILNNKKVKKNVPKTNATVLPLPPKPDKGTPR